MLKQVKKMRRFFLLIFLCLIIILSGCHKNPKTNLGNHNQLNVDLTKLSTNQQIDQTYSNQAKDVLAKENDLTSIKAVNTDKKLIVSFEVDHFKRFQLENIRTKLEKKIKKNFSNLDVLVSTDQKIILELGNIEKDLQNNKITVKELNKKVNHLMSLAKEKT